MSDNIKLLKNYLLYLLVGIVICFVGVTGVCADTYGSFENITTKTMLYVESPLYSSPVQVPLNTSYNFYDVLQLDILVDNYSFLPATHYQLEFVLTDTTLENANSFRVIGDNGMTCLIDYNRSLMTGNWLYFDFQCPSSTNHLTISVYNSNDNYLWSYNPSGTPFGWERSQIRTSDTSLEGSGSDTSNIINNNNQNTQNIINNNNQNTQEIIDNQNANTDKEIESQKVCSFGSYNLVTGTIDGSSGLDRDANNRKRTDFIHVRKNYNYTIKNNTSALIYIFTYDENKNFISRIPSDWTSVPYDYISSNNVSYIRVLTYTTYPNTVTIENCRNGNQALDDTLNDDDTSGATSEASVFFNSFNTNTFGLTSIITAPLNLIQSLTSSSCIELHLPLPYLDNKYLDLPCMTSIYQTHFGAFFSMYQTITYGIIAYWVCVRIFNQVKDFKNPEHDEIEVVDL